jgi:predicted Fe-Mo cluster-binding NifX family protein
LRIAIPLFGNNISPRFDCSESILLIDITKFHVKEEDILEIGKWPPSLKNNLLSKLKVDVLLCGGIRKIDYLELTDLGIEVYPSLTGTIEEVKRAFTEGKIPGPAQKKVCSVMQSSKAREGEGTVGQTKSNKTLSAKKDT